jgi:hypothetical protein
MPDISPMTIASDSTHDSSRFVLCFMLSSSLKIFLYEKTAEPDRV